MQKTLIEIRQYINRDSETTMQDQVPGKPRKPSESGDQLLCEPCLDLGLEHIVVGFCVECNDYLCRNCYKHHHKPKVYREHVLLDENAMPKVKPEQTATPDDKDQSEKCSKHKGEAIKYYCRSDRQFVCATCMIENHLICGQPINIKDEYESLENKLKTISMQVDNHSKTKENNSAVIESNHSKAVKEIKHFLTDIKSFFETLGNDMIKEANKIKGNDETKMKNISATCSTLRNEIGTLTAGLAKSQQAHQHKKLLVMMEEAKYRIKTFAKDIKQMNNENKVHTYCFETETEIKGMMGKLQSLGELAIEDQLCDEEQHDNILDTSDEDTPSPDRTESAIDQKPIEPSESDAVESFSRVPFKQRQTSKDLEINVKTAADEQPRVTGLTVLSDDNLVLIDYNNLAVKRVHTKLDQGISELKLPSRPQDITIINDKQVAITMPDSQTIQMVSILKGALSLSQTIKVKGQCHGIVHNNGELFVTFVRPAKVEIISMNGTVRKLIDRGANGVPLFVQPRYIAISLQKTHVYITDYHQQSVTCMTIGGDINGVFRAKGFNKFSGVTVDKSGSLYVVCGGYHSHIYQISADCSRGQKLLGQGQRLLWYPWAIAYCQKEDKLYVGEINRNIKVFQLQ